MLLTSSDGMQRQRRRDAGRIAERRLGVLIKPHEGPVNRSENRRRRESYKGQWKIMCATVSMPPWQCGQSRCSRGNCIRKLEGCCFDVVGHCARTHAGQQPPNVGRPPLVPRGDCVGAAPRLVNYHGINIDHSNCCPIISRTHIQPSWQCVEVEQMAQNTGPTMRHCRSSELDWQPQASFAMPFCDHSPNARESKHQRLSSCQGRLRRHLHAAACCAGLRWLSVT